MSGWRLVNLDERDPYFISSIQEMLRKAMGRGIIPNSIVPARFSKSTAMVGRGSPINRVLNREYCDRQGITIVRGDPAPAGISNYFDGSQLLCSFVWKPAEKTSYNDVLVLFQEGIVRATEVLGLKSSIEEGGNDVFVGARKIGGVGVYGDGETWTGGISLLTSFDFDVAERATVPKHDMRSMMTTLNAEAGRQVPLEEVISALKEGFESVLEVEFVVSGDLTDEEKKIINRLSEKYHSEEWIKTGKWSPVKDYWRPK